jgi:hypothetical protein
MGCGSLQGAEVKQRMHSFRHDDDTIVLESLTSHPWLLIVVKPSIDEDDEKRFLIDLILV